jgi:NAD(P)-dependent dehydrogenase (short-subunit alcohol dehydrogenase family)
MDQLDGRVAVVTGAASGIGRGLALRFAAEGMRVVLADVEPGPLQEAVEEIRATGAEAVGVPTDVSQLDQVEALAAQAVETFGAVHVLCNNAGVETGGAFQDIPIASWRWVLDVNLWGVIYGCRTFLPILRTQDCAHIVNTGSLASFSFEAPTFTPYTVSKYGVLAVSECLAMELRDEPIGVSILAPGLVRTNMTKAERNRPADVPSTADDPVRRGVLDMLQQLTDDAGMTTAEVAQLVVDAILADRLYVLTHPDQAISAVESRVAAMQDQNG